jgi:FtsP/CotA-like multicopper oxidase with cupredoxin domain
MDGVAGLTQPPVAPGTGFDYEFVVPAAGSYMYHSHVGNQLDRGLYGPLIVEPNREELGYDREFTLMLDDWRDGMVGASPAPSGPPPTGGPRRPGGSGSGGLGGLGSGVGGSGGHGGHGGAPVEPEEETAAGVVSFGGRRYPILLVNGRPPDDPFGITVKRGDRIRLRVMNIGADTGFRFAIGGHRLTVTHADGMPVRPVIADAIRLGMGERYDVLVEATNPGTWQVAVLPEGRDGLGRALLRYAESPSATAPPETARPAELDGQLLHYDDLDGDGADRFPAGGAPDRRYALTLSGMEIDGQRYPDADPLPVARGEWVRVTMRNTGTKWHPMHLHGHHVLVATASGRGPLKDTVSVPGGGGEVTFDVRADNPGRWLFHCHNHYHMEDGMARVVEYR